MFVLSFGLFSDVNECRENPQICQNGTCLNSDGSYSCICNEGFEADEYQRCIGMCSYLD